MDLTGLPPPHMDWASSNLQEAWENFERHAKYMFDGPLKGKSGKEVVAYILLWIGDRGRSKHTSWKDVTEDDMKSTENIFGRFKSCVQPKLNPIFARFTFYHEVQNSESINAFVTRLKLSAIDCQFGGSTDDMIRDRIVFGCTSHKIREKLIDIGQELTLEKSVQIAQSFEYSNKQLQPMKGSERDDQEVHQIRGGKQGKPGRSKPIPAEADSI